MSLKRLANLLEKAGEGAYFLFDKSLEGFADVFKTGMVLFNNLAFDGSEKTFKIFSFLFMHRIAIAEAFYPTQDLAKYVLENPDDINKKFKLYKQFRKKKDFYYKLSMGLSILPHQKQMMEKILNNNAEEKKVYKALEMFELRSYQTKILKKLNKVSEEELENCKDDLSTLIKIKLELNELDGLDEYLEVAKNIKVIDYNLLKATMLVKTKDYKKAITYYELAIDEDIEYAKEELGELLDILKKEEVEINIEEIKEKYFPTIVGSETWNKFKSLPLAYISVKAKEWQGIMEKNKG